jgi:hypothetical protein
MYIITVRRITSGELLKQRNGLRIAGGYGRSLRASSQLTLTMPSWARHWRAPRRAIVCLFAVLTATQAWFLETAFAGDYASALAYSYSAGAEVYISLFLPLFAWHVCDLLQVDPPRAGGLLFLDGYPFLVGTLVAFGAAGMFHHSTFLNDFGCPEVSLPSGVYQFDGCGSWTPWWKTLLAIVPLVILYCLPLWKLIISGASHLRTIRHRA